MLVLLLKFQLLVIFSCFSPLYTVQGSSETSRSLYRIIFLLLNLAWKPVETFPKSAPQYTLCFISSLVKGLACETMLYVKLEKLAGTFYSEKFMLPIS